MLKYPGKSVYYTKNFSLVDKDEKTHDNIEDLKKILGVDKVETVIKTKEKIVIALKKAGKINYDISNKYYQAANGFKGEELLEKLHDIVRPSVSAKEYEGLYPTYSNGSFLDYIYENDETVLDIYSENPNGKDPYNFTDQKCGGSGYQKEGDCYNREHLIPQSKFGKKSPMHNDAQFVWPTDGKVNGKRSNYPHDNIENTK
jgi:hypothetical protein